MNTNTQLRNSNDLLPGDVILCYCDPSKDLVAKKIHSVTSSDYSHAAIYYGDGLAAESRVSDGSKKGGIVKTKINDLVSRYLYVAVLRQPDAWVTADRTGALKFFIDRVVASGAKYNLIGVCNFESRKELHKVNALENVKRYFEGDLSPISTEKDAYFCSEFVCDCFIAVGFISPSASIVFRSDTYAPGDLGKEAAFGTFWGYLSTKQETQDNEHDCFYRVTPYDVMFGSQRCGQ